MGIDEASGQLEFEFDDRRVEDPLPAYVPKLEAFFVDKVCSWITADGLEDTYRADDLEFRQIVAGILWRMNSERNNQGMDLLTDDEKTQLIYELFKVFRLFGDDMRKNGKNIAKDHLFGSLMILVSKIGVTTISEAIAQVNHDTVEDKLPEHLVGSARRDAKRTLYGQIGDIVEYEHRLDRFKIDPLGLMKDNQKMRLKACSMVRGVTKIKLDSRDATADATFKVFLQSFLMVAETVLIKLADRVHNLRTLDGHSSEKKKRAIVEQTEQVYLPFARICMIQEVVKEYVDRCVGFSNKELVDWFNGFVRARFTERLLPYMEDIDMELKDCPYASNVHFEEKDLAYYTRNYGGAFRDLKPEDIEIGEDDPMFRVVIITESNNGGDGEREVMAAVGHVIQKFAAQGGESIVIDKPAKTDPFYNQGVIINVFSKLHGGNLQFRVVDSKANSRAKMGVFGGYSKVHMKALRDMIKGVLINADEGNVIDTAREDLLQPWVRVKTKDGETMSLPKGATGLDFARAARETFFVGMKGLQVKDSNSDEGDGKQVSIYDPLVEGKCYKVIWDKDVFTLHPSHLLFVKPSAARALSRRLKKMPVSEEEDRDEVIANMGLEYIRDLARLYDVPFELIQFELMHNYNNALKWDEICRKVGVCEIEPVEFFADCFSHCLEAVENLGDVWEFEVEVPNVSGSGATIFKEEFSKDVGYNIDFVGQNNRMTVDGEMAVLTFRIDIKGQEIKLHDFLKKLLKLSFRYPTVLTKKPFDEDSLTLTIKNLCGRERE